MSEQPSATSDNVLTKLHDLLLYIIPQLGKFPRDQKFLLADRIEVRLLEVQERCLRAHYSRDKAEHLREANMGVPSHGSVGVPPASVQPNHCGQDAHAPFPQSVAGKMIGGWLKSVGERR